MNIGVVSSGLYSMGHALVGHRVRSYIEKAECAVQYFSDQHAVLSKSGICRDAKPLSALREFCLENHGSDNILFFDTIPLRRRNLFYSLKKATATTRAVRVTGHTGWLPVINKTLVNCWRDLLDFFSIHIIVVYHDAEVCKGRCHLAALAPALNVRVIHSGLLYPPEVKVAHRCPRSLLVSMGGGAASETIVQLANRISATTDWDVTLFLGPYASYLNCHPV
jgi:hypothetical protein